ncbi:unnamed protein product [Clonostachys byssicola]|uniref:Secreted protein n=1 Tax=Clonostachys byssicola TaxID=160290 RepID=A0A9N9Y3Y6_9HYPO|nr:unnamed protein product [Clonostachys byssicola]
MHIRKVAAALLLAASPWLAAAYAPTGDPFMSSIDKKWRSYAITGAKVNTSLMLPGVVECLHSTQASAGTRFRIKWKGFCEDWKGMCIRALIHRYAGMIDNWQAWKPDDRESDEDHGWWKPEDDDWYTPDEDSGWWRADFTLIGI